jgi:hypothetical protein
MSTVLLEKERKREECYGTTLIESDIEDKQTVIE